MKDKQTLEHGHRMHSGSEPDAACKALILREGSVELDEVLK